MFEQTDYRRSKQTWIMKQDHPWRVKWEGFIILLAIWNSITLPLDLAFDITFFKNTYVELTNHLIDFLFILDIIFTFRTSF